MENRKECQGGEISLIHSMTCMQLGGEQTALPKEENSQQREQQVQKP